MDDDLQRLRIDALLAGGLHTASALRAYSADDVNAVCRRLRGLGVDDVEAKLVLAGFTRQPYVDAGDQDGIKQCCALCIYFERHRGFCALPELMLAVEPRWSCILWRV